MNNITTPLIMKRTRVKISTDSQIQAEWAKVKSHREQGEKAHLKRREQNRRVKRLFLLLTLFWLVVGAIAVILF